jgi:hypothetical protein
VSAARANRDRRAEATTYAASQAALVLVELELAKRECAGAYRAGLSPVTTESVEPCGTLVERTDAGSEAAA